ncbi:hypothetical protein K1X84_09295 [bacterium]|nr:hypothetical protein [bacterium]
MLSITRRQIKFFFFLNFLLIRCSFAQSVDVADDSSALSKQLYHKSVQELIEYSRDALHWYLLHNQDSLGFYLEQWQSVYGSIEPAQRIRNLWNLRDGTFSSDSINSTFLATLLEYRDHKFSEYRHQPSESKPNRLIYKNPWRYVESSFNDRTKSEASVISKRLSPDSISYRICRFYAGDFDTLLLPLYDGRLPISPLTGQYQNLKSSFRFGGEIRFGSSIPTGHASVLNPHPFLGFAFGTKMQELEAMLGMSFFISRSQHSILAKNYSGSQSYARKFFGDSFFLDGSVSLIRRPYHELRVVGGISWYQFSNDWGGLFTSIITGGDDDDDETDPDSITINAFAPQIGFEYRYYTKIIKESFWGIRFSKYFTKLNNHGGTNLEGALLSISIIRGFER